jgi:phytoene synthase
LCRVLDDCVDEVGGGGEAGLDRWQEEIRLCYAGRPATELGRELAEALARFPIPRACFDDIVAGCRMDLRTTRYATFAELRVYCERVASAVGLACIEIFGYTDRASRGYAVELGLALQLTNILRDLGSDAERGRLYLPLEDLARYAVSEEQLLALARGEASARPAELDALLRFEGARAREHFGRARALLPEADRRSMLAAEIMGAVYRALLEEIDRRGYPVGGPRVALSRLRKAWLALATLARVRWLA